jgi:beta-lactamase superfamily II metal-dependent hydrolase
MERTFLRKIFTFRRLLLIVCAFCVLLLPSNGLSSPPDYKTFGRDQLSDYNCKQNELLRIWVVYVGQGDGILIQLPPKYNYDPDPDDGIDAKSERIDVLIDGGSYRGSNANRMLAFLQTLYDPTSIIIENAVITHHDLDHIKGATAILNEPTVSIENIFHNGLASYRYAGRIKTAVDNAAGSIVKKSSNKIVRVLATTEADKETVQNSILINNKMALKKSYDEDLLHAIYKDLAAAILEKEEPQGVGTFERVWENSEFIPNTDDIRFQVMWPPQKLSVYSDWGQTINGNSVTFLLKYRDFEMLFTGDHNEKSEAALIAHLKANGNEALLNCDVLKAPHHGSAHILESFIRPEGAPAVLTVASMGAVGFAQGWKHPSTDVIKWAGGAHRFYSTYIHERRFTWEDMLDAKKHAAMQEIKHILIETDGIMFRIVEIEVDNPDPNNPPSVKKVKRSDGTRWIKASK